MTGGGSHTRSLEPGYFIWGTGADAENAIIEQTPEVTEVHGLGAHRGTAGAGL